MAPLHIHYYFIFSYLKKKKIEKWVLVWRKVFGEVFYTDEFKKSEILIYYNVALSEPLPEDNWTGQRVYSWYCLRIT
jgi:Na+-transporting NADH:ubiquinone oxidoreductase subunit F